MYVEEGCKVLVPYCDKILKIWLQMVLFLIYALNV